MTRTRSDSPVEVIHESPLQGASLGADPEEAELAHYLDVVVRGKWFIAAALVLSFVFGGAYVAFATPVYRSDALVQVESKKAGTGGLDDLSALLGESSPAETEIEIIRSRALIGEAVDELKLDIRAEPRRFPVVGGLIARRWRSREPRPAPVIGFRRFAWGGERIAVGRLDVPRELVGEPLLLQAGVDGKFVLRGPGEVNLLEGSIGDLAAGNGVSLLVSELVARPGTNFILSRERREEVVAHLQDSVRVMERGKKTGIIELSLEGSQPARTAAFLNAVAGAYLRQNQDRKSAEAAKTLAFLEEQLPDIRANVDQAEKALEVYKAAHGSMDVSLDTKAALERAAEVEKGIVELKLEYTGVRQRFTDSHPIAVAVRKKIEKLQAELASNEQRFRKLPAAELDSARLMRDVKVANDVYVTLLNKAQELKVVKEGTLGNVRILDSALTSYEPVAPKKVRVLSLALLLGLLGGVGVAFIRTALFQGMSDPNQLESLTGIAVHASVLHSDANSGLALHAKKSGGRPPLIALEDPKDLAVETLRALRTSLQFTLFEAKSNVVVLGGPAPSVGKSFVTANLAHLLGEAGKRVVVVDADLRRGHLHELYGLRRGKGLSDVVAGDLPVKDALAETASPRVRLLPSGTVPPNPAEILGSERFQHVLAELSREADVVLVDTPPILAVTDGVLVARHAGVVLLVLRAGKHPPREIQTALRHLARAGVRVNGLVLNDVRTESGIGRYSYNYHYQYKYD